MTTEQVLAHRPSPLGRRLVVLSVVAFARVLSRRPPASIRRVLRLAARGARPATREEAAAARREVVANSAFCAGPVGCLPRSITTALLCRMRGGWPTWAAGVRRHPPFGAHAWVEAEGAAVDEPYPDGFHIPLLIVPPGEGQPG